MATGFVDHSELQASSFSFGLELAHIFDTEDDLDLRPALLRSRGAVKSNGAAATRRAHFKPAIFRSSFDPVIFRSGQRLQAEVLLIKRGDFRNVTNIENDPGDRQRVHRELLQKGCGDAGEFERSVE